MALTPLGDARAYVLSSLPAPTARAVPLRDALGSVMADDVMSAESIPPFANTAMDGFAVRAADTAGATDAAPVGLRVVGTIRAGDAPDLAAGPGEAIRIMTGAPMPPGADAVVMVERTSAADDGTTVEVFAEVAPGTHVRPAGDDLRPGQLVFRAGDTITAGHLGVLASIGCVDITVIPRVRVGVFSTGDELVDGPQPLGPGQIRDSNRITLLALVSQSGADGIDLGRIPDDEDAIAAAIADGADRCDAIITSGGVSMGDFDFVKVVLDRVGDMRWMQVAIRPAKPLAFGTVAGRAPSGTDGPRRVPVFGLPGNPVSSMVSFELFARPALRQMMGHGPDDLDRPHVIATSADGFDRRPDGKTHLVRVVATYDPSRPGYRVRSAGAQGSHHLTAMAAANALAILPDGDGVPADAPVTVMLLS